MTATGAAASGVDPVLSRARLLTLRLTAFVAATTLLAIAGGYVVLGWGDPSLRFVMSLDAATDLLAYAGDWGNWTGDWPAGHFLLQGAWIRGLEALGVRSVPLLGQSVLVASVLAWLASLALVRATVAAVRGAVWGWLAALAFLALSVIVELGHNGYGAIYFVALYLLALRALVAFERSGRARWLAAAALPLLVATTFRPEAVIVAAGIASVVLMLHGWRPAAGFLASSGAFTFFRMILAPAAIASQVRDESLLMTLVDFASLGLYLVVPSGIVLTLLAVAFRSRMPAVGRHAGPSEALAAYAAASAGLLLAFFFTAMFVLTRMGANNRFLAVSIVGALVAVVCTAARPPGEVWGALRRWIGTWVVVSSLVQIFVLGVDYLEDRPRPPVGIREAAAWLHEHGEPGRGIAVDHLNWWEWTLLTYGSRTPDEVRGSYQNWGDEPGSASSDGEPPRTLGRALSEVAPAYIVRANHTVRERKAASWGPEWTFLDAWSRTGRARIVLENEDVTIYEITR